MPIDIDPAAGLVLPDGPDGDRPRFAQAFGHAWAMVPAADQARIVNWWHAGFAGEASPVLQLVAGYQMAAAAEAAGHHLFFNADVVDSMPVPILRHLIGHELAHVLHYSLPGSQANAHPPNHALKEAEADATADGWGFSMHDLRAWANANAAGIAAATGNPNVGW